MQNPRKTGYGFSVTVDDDHGVSKFSFHEESPGNYVLAGASGPDTFIEKTKPSPAAQARAISLMRASGHRVAMTVVK